MSDNNTDTPRNSFIFLIPFGVFALFIISSVMVAYFVWDISPLDERLKNEMEALKTNATIFGGFAVLINLDCKMQNSTTLICGQQSFPKPTCKKHTFLEPT